MLVLIGTVPYTTGLYIGKAGLKGRSLRVGGIDFPVERGTAAMAASAAQVCGFYGLEAPLCIFAGDVADGKGTELIFEEVNQHIERYDPDLITLHYMFPKIACGQPFMDKIDSLAKRPQLIADAGGMYLIKTVSMSHRFDCFTPDEGELYFLADEFAPHPLYVRSELLDKKLSVEELVGSAYTYKNTAVTTVIKGVVDRVYRDGVKVRELSGPNIPAMEAIGGTGDTITGMLSALRYKKDPDAEYKALIINRRIGQTIRCTPATQIAEFIQAIPEVLHAYEKTLG